MSFIDFEEFPGKSGLIGIITLNRPQALNALSYEMVTALYHQLIVWSEYNDLLAIILRSASEKAFCAGGDIRALYQERQTPQKLVEFFHDEYCLDYLIATYPKPIVSLMNGIVMGGGAGIGIHTSHRVASSDLVFAMPETAIGLFTDVGASYFLNKAPGYLGYYLGLSGAKINIADAYYAGFIDYCLSQEHFDNFVDSLSTATYNENTVHEVISKLLTSFSVQLDESTFKKQQDFIDGVFSNDAVKGILNALKHDDSEWSQAVSDHLLQKCPLSLAVNLELLKRAKTMDVRACFKQDFTVAQSMTTNPNFFEGVRAMIIDKDMRPLWQPSNIENISENDITEFFTTTQKLDLPI